VAFLEKESQPRVNANLLTIHEKETSTAGSRKSSVTGSTQETVTEAAAAATPDTSSPVPILLGENSLVYNNRNSSTILKDLLHDT
jgi:hypothetical protein